MNHSLSRSSSPVETYNRKKVQQIYKSIDKSIAGYPKEGGDSMVGMLESIEKGAVAVAALFAAIEGLCVAFEEIKEAIERTESDVEEPEPLIIDVQARPI